MKGKKVAKYQKKGPPTKKPKGKEAKALNSKRLNRHANSSETDSDDSGSESSSSEVEIKFELFNMAETDYHSIKQYLTNCFGAGDHGVDLVGLTSFIVEALADHLGTCVKTDGETSDPFGFLTGFPLSFAEGQPFLASLEKFIRQKCDKMAGLDNFFSSGRNVILFQERLINVPGSIAAPLYRQFLDDWRMAASDDPKNFSNPKEVLIITPTYKEVISQLDRELGLKENPSKFDCASSETCFYYEEAEFLGAKSSKFTDFSVNTGHETSDSRRAFSENGIEPGRRAFLISWDNFNKLVEQLEAEIIE